MDFGLIMYLGLFLLSIYTFAGVSASHTILVANNEGVHIVDTNSKQNKTVLPFERRANSVGYNLKTGYVYSILKNNQEMQHRIVRKKVLDALETHSCNQKELVDWCYGKKYCIKICNSSNPYNPEKVLEPYRCFRANNLVLDWINNNIYWTCDPRNSLSSTLNMATSEGVNNKTILSRTKPIQSVDIDPFEEKLIFLESNNLFGTRLDGKNENNIYKFDNPNAEIIKIILDIQKKTIIAFGHMLENKDERFLASLNYDGLDYKKIYTSKDPAWEVGPKIVNIIVYRLTLSNGTEWHSVGDSGTEGKIKMEKIFVRNSGNQWCLLHLEAQKPVDGSNCRTRGCSHGCNLSHWMTITCQCPSGMSLGANKRTCYENHIEATEDISKTPLFWENSTSSSEIKGEPKMVSPESGITTEGTVVQPAVNGSRDLAKSVVEASQNATETAGAVTAFSSNATLFHIVFTTICISIFIVVVVVRKRYKMGNDGRTDFYL